MPFPTLAIRAQSQIRPRNPANQTCSRHHQTSASLLTRKARRFGSPLFRHKFRSSGWRLATRGRRGLTDHPHGLNDPTTERDLKTARLARPIRVHWRQDLHRCRTPARADIKPSAAIDSRTPSRRVMPGSDEKRRSESRLAHHNPGNTRVGQRMASCAGPAINQANAGSSVCKAANDSRNSAG